MGDLFTAKVRVSLVIAMAGLALAGCEDIRLSWDTPIETHEYVMRKPYQTLVPLPDPTGSRNAPSVEVYNEALPASTNIGMSSPYGNEDYPPYSRR